MLGRARQLCEQPMHRNLLAIMLMIAMMSILVGTSESAFPALLEKYTISLDEIGIAFDIPKGYGIFEMTDSLHYSIGTTIQFGKELRSGHLNHIPGLTMGFWPTAPGVRSAIPAKVVKEAVARSRVALLSIPSDRDCATARLPDCVSALWHFPSR